MVEKWDSVLGPIKLYHKLYNYNSMELWNFNWSRKQMAKIRSSQDFTLINSCTELSFSMWVSLRQVGGMVGY